MKQVTMTRFELITMHLETILRVNTKNLNEARERLFAEDQFEQAFKWESETIYKMSYQNRNIKTILEELMKANENGVLTEKLQYYQMYFGGQILNHYINRSTSPIANIAIEWEFESKQELYKLMQTCVNNVN